MARLWRNAVSGLTGSIYSQSETSSLNFFINCQIRTAVELSSMIFLKVIRECNFTLSELHPRIFLSHSKLIICPIKFHLCYGQTVFFRIFVPVFQNSLRPIFHRIVELTIYQIAEVNRSARFMILYVIHFM